MDHYETLGLARDATHEDVKKAYRAKAKQYHPDRNPGDPTAAEKFKEVQTAYDVLSDQDKRKRYDINPNFDNVMMPPSDWAFNFNDLFSQFFQQQRGTKVNRGGHIQTSLAIEFMEAVTGCKKEISIDRREVCVECKGNGTKDGTSFQKCVPCGGRGKTVQRFSGGGGVVNVETECQVCDGNGRVVSAICTHCAGRGFAVHHKVLEVSLPAGIEDGAKVCVHAQGDVGEAGAGNLYCIVHVREHPVFKREGADLYLTMPVSYAQAVLGGTVKVPVVKGWYDLKLPTKTPSGTILKIEKLGVFDQRRDIRGDLWVEIVIDIPEELDDKYISLLQQMQKLDEEHVGHNARIFNEKVRR